MKNNKRLIVWLFFVLFLCAGLWIVKDYGISWDEPLSRMNGVVMHNYVTKGDQNLFAYHDRHYGTAFELPLVFMERLLDLRDTRAIYFMRHFFTFSFFYVAVFFFYLLCERHFRSWKIGLVGSFFLILSPRIFAHSFYNSKDLVFLSMFVIAIYTLVRYLDKKTIFWAVAHAASCAILVDIRVLGIMVPFFTVLLVFAGIIEQRADKKEIVKITGNFLIHILLLVFFIVLFWPFLWENPVKYFTEAVRQMSRFPWRGAVLYLGDMVKASELPWHYIPVWIIITTPLVYIFFFLAGLTVLAVSFLKKPAGFVYERRNDLIFLAWFFLPIIMILSLKSVLYDSWRHLFFVYPAFLMIALTGLVSIFKGVGNLSRPFHVVGRTVLVLVIALDLALVAGFMAKNHPHQNVYFNKLAGRDMKDIKNKFELDYWGLSYRKALEYVLKHDKGRDIRVFPANAPGIYNSFLLPFEDRERLTFVKDPNEARYFISNYRWHKEEYPIEPEIYSVKVDGAKIMVLLKLK